MNNRIWELDAFRGFCIIGVVIVHFIFDLTELYGILHWDTPALFRFVQLWGGTLFFLLSGVCATLSGRSLRRGFIVFGCGLLCTAVTAGMYLLGIADQSIIIRFGVLHCLGICMILWAAFRGLPVWVLGVLCAVLIGLGFRFPDIQVESAWLFPLGLVHQGFVSSDYFPLLPNLGFFLLGSILGRVLYRNKKTLFPQVDPQIPAIRFLGFCGRQSLFIYLLHQPVLSLVCLVLSLL